MVCQSDFLDTSTVQQTTLDEMDAEMPYGDGLNDTTTSDSTETQNTVPPTQVRSHDTDDELCKQFYERTCGCKKADGKPCSSLFPLEHFVENQPDNSSAV